MARDPNVVSLQNAINRFAPYAGFAPVGVDGGVGEETAGGVVKALAWIQSNVSGAGETPAGLINRIVLDTGAYNYTQIQTSASGLATYLNQSANAAALPVAPAPIVATGGGVPTYPPISYRPPSNNLAAGLAQMWKGLPTWGKVLAGAVAGFGLVAGVSAMKRHKTA